MNLTLPRWRDHGVGLGLAVLYLVLLIRVSPQVGVPRDESFYFYAGDRAGDWVLRLFEPGVQSFSEAEIKKGFEYNHEHPVLMKTLFGLSHRLVHDKWGWTDLHVTAYRLPTMIMASLAIWLAWLMGVMLSGRVAGLVAAVALGFMPRVFFHDQLACFDAPVTFMWTLIAYTFLRAARSRGWAIACGVAFGLGLATKLNVFFVPLSMAGVALLDAWTYKRGTGRWRAPEGERGPLTYHTWTAISGAVLGTAVFFAHWPWMWSNTVRRLGEYLGFHLRHVNYPVDYFGTLYYDPPFPVHFPFVMTLTTVPVGTLVLGGIGLAVLTRAAIGQWRTGDHAPRAAAAFVLVNVAVPILVIAMPTTPIFGGIKHWMPAMPFFAVAAGLGAVKLGEGLFRSAREPVRRAGGLVTALLMLVPAVWATLAYHPYGEAYYNELAGGPVGAARLRLPRNFWGYATIGALPQLNEQAEKGALVFWHDATNWAIDAYKRDEYLRRDIKYTGDWTAAYSDWGVYHDQRDKFWEELDVWRAYGTDWPVGGVFLDGVQLVGLYRRPAPPKAPPVVKPPGSEPASAPASAPATQP